EGVSSRGTPRQVVGRPGMEFKFWTGGRRAFVGNGNEAQAPFTAESSAFSEPPGMSVGRGAHQAIQLGFRPAGQKRAADVASRGRWCDQSGGYSGTGGSSITRHSAAIVRCARRVSRSASDLSAAFEDGT